MVYFCVCVSAEDMQNNIKSNVSTHSAVHIVKVFAAVCRIQEGFSFLFIYMHLLAQWKNVRK